MPDDRRVTAIEERLASIEEDRMRLLAEWGQWRGGIDHDLTGLRQEVDRVERQLGLQLEDLSARITKYGDEAVKTAKEVADTLAVSKKEWDTFAHRLMYAVVMLIALASPSSLAAVKHLIGLP